MCFFSLFDADWWQFECVCGEFGCRDSADAARLGRAIDSGAGRDWWAIVPTRSVHGRGGVIAHHEERGRLCVWYVLAMQRQLHCARHHEASHCTAQHSLGIRHQLWAQRRASGNSHWHGGIWSVCLMDAHGFFLCARSSTLLLSRAGNFGCWSQNDCVDTRAHCSIACHSTGARACASLYWR